MEGGIENKEQGAEGEKHTAIVARLRGYSATSELDRFFLLGWRSSEAVTALTASTWISLSPWGGDMASN